MPNRVPKPNANVDFKSLPLTPVEGYLFTRVDGRLSIREIAREVGMDEHTVISALEKLALHNVVRFVDDTPAAPPKEEPAKLPPGPSRRASLLDPSELEEDCDLNIEEKTRVLELHQALEEDDFYALLGVPRNAEKKAIKRAYYDVARNVHPDRFFRKRLGSFKQKMEKVFGRLTEANDTLTDRDKRAEYDLYLDAVASTRAVENELSRGGDQMLFAEEALLREVNSRPASEPPPAALPPMRPPTPSTVDIQARKQALAKRLMGGAPPRPLPAPKPASPPGLRYENTQDAVDALKRRYHERLDNARIAQSQKYEDVAAEAFAAGDFVAAANSFRVALSFRPEDTVLKGQADEAQKKANDLLSEAYLKQANFEERFEKWPEAARSWSRVARIRPQDARANERAANAIWKADGNLHEAADFAQQAISLEPQNVEHRLTLANVYASAGLTIAAIRELESALPLAPAHAGIQALLKRLKKTD